jgi:acetolactate decarboxylase
MHRLSLSSNSLFSNNFLANLKLLAEDISQLLQRGIWVTIGNKLVVATAAALVAVVLFVSFYALALPEQDMLYQVLPFNMLAAGNFEGNTTYAELAKHGDFGIGTLNDLNGEMIAINGKFYQIPTEGAPREIGSSEKTPYATITFFRSDYTFQVANVSSYSQLAFDINSTLPNYNAIYAIKVHGFFSFAETRSVPIQTKPYPTLWDAVKNQTVFNLNDASATAVGFFFPDSMNGVDYVGYHLHLLTDNYSAGGHLLECTIESATIEIDQINNYRLLIP